MRAREAPTPCPDDSESDELLLPMERVIRLPWWGRRPRGSRACFAGPGRCVESEREEARLDVTNRGRDQPNWGAPDMAPVSGAGLA